MNNKLKWDIRFLRLCKEISTWSKDPSTKCGSVIVKDRRVISHGFNGFPQYVNDNEKRYIDRKLKYDMIVHAEINALLFSQMDLTTSTLYVWPLPPCSRCAGPIIQAGISRVVSIKLSSELEKRWEKNIAISNIMFYEAHIETDFIDEDLI